MASNADPGKVAPLRTALRVDQLMKRFVSQRGDVLALDRVSFAASAGEFVCLVGPSGCGKSTLLRLIAGLLAPTAGNVVFTPGQAQPQIAMVFQDAGLFPWLRVVDNVAFGLEARGMAPAVRRNEALELLQRTGLAEFAGHYPYELSGGMQQRVALARALVTQPDLLLLDEPFRALDAQTRLLMQEQLLRLWEARACLVLFVTHDIEEAILLGDRVLVMSGRPGQILMELDVPLSRPRDLSGRSHVEIEEMRWRIWKMLEPAARSSLALPPSEA
ncbi:MAG: ABC transporter ATP-binding protein [Anaerolineales bacterium]|nr:ABC transporter ATP-binding protein [Anaerolineales bacterium]